ncbi:MAG: tRNA 4-thiouridine(8) synthase ThiI [Mycoplasmataceae bacterium]|nr:tRNA 4-thiouridine(8) synthase ThiI [Mycoplasmataceae bacterium]
MYDKILVRYGELSLKGKNKMTFVRTLARNIKKTCSIDEKDIVVSFDRIYIKYSKDVMDNLQYVFGISSYSGVYVCNSNITDIENTIRKLFNPNSKTFKCISRRSFKNFEMSSIEMNNHFGSFILSNNTNYKVQIKNPDDEFNIEVHKEYTYIFSTKTLGLGGLPVGTAGKVLHLISGGIDSPVAAFEMMKRGVHIEFLSFLTPPHTDQTTMDKVNQIITTLTKYQGASKLYSFNYTDLMNYIGMTSKQGYKIILMRRSFYRIASIIANENNCLGVSNGENLGQVASQTLEAMAVVQTQSTLPVYRPLLTHDKLDIIKKGILINTYNTSIIQASEACELFAPASPATKPSLKIAQYLEEELSNLFALESQGIQENITVSYFKNNS